MDAAFCGAADLRKGRQKRELAGPACSEQGGKLCTDVSAQSRICLFIDAGHAGVHGTAGQRLNGRTCSGC